MQLAWRLEVIGRDDLQRCPRWQVAFANERKDHRYYELVEDTLHPEFEYRYFVLRDAIGQISAVQPFSCWIKICWSDSVRAIRSSSTLCARCCHA